VTKRTLLLAGGALAAVGGAAALAMLLSKPAAPELPVCKTFPPSPQPGIPAGWQLFSGFVSATASARAREALSLPMGSQDSFTDDDGSLLGILLMWHCHDPSEGVTPVGWHKGATLFRIS